jgi:hypothetical protein
MSFRVGLGGTYRQTAPLALPSCQALATPAGFAADETLGSGGQVALPPVVDGGGVFQPAAGRVRRGLAAVGQRPVLTLGVHVVIANCKMK